MFVVQAEEVLLPGPWLQASRQPARLQELLPPEDPPPTPMCLLALLDMFQLIFHHKNVQFQLN